MYGPVTRIREALRSKQHGKACYRLPAHDQFSIDQRSLACHSERGAKLAGLTKDHLDWQMHRLMIYGKGGPYGTKSKRRIIPLSPRVQTLLEGHLALHDKYGIGTRTMIVGPRSTDNDRDLFESFAGRSYLGSFRISGDVSINSF